MVLALDGVDGDAVVGDERGGHLVLRRERVRGAEHEIGSARRQRAGEVRRLARDVQAGGQAHALQGLLLREALADLPEDRHARVGPLDPGLAPGGECEVLDVVPRRGGRFGRHGLPRHRSGSLEPGRLGQRIGAVGLLPRELGQAAAEVAEGRRGLVDRAGAGSSASMMPLGVSAKCSRISATIRLSGSLPVPKVSTWTETGSATPIAYASWIERPLGDAGRHEVLGDVARHVGGRSVDLRRIFARERAAAVRRAAAVGVHDDLAARQAACRPGARRSRTGRSG